MAEEVDAALIAEQPRHTINLLRAEIRSLQAEQNHQRELYQSRLQSLENQNADHEIRLRAVQDSATQFKVLAGLATGGGLLSVISLLRVLIG
jgi:hypothetical protein